MGKFVYENVVLVVVRVPSIAQEVILKYTASGSTYTGQGTVLPAIKCTRRRTRTTTGICTSINGKYSLDVIYDVLFCTSGLSTASFITNSPQILRFVKQLNLPLVGCSVIVLYSGYEMIETVINLIIPVGIIIPTIIPVGIINQKTANTGLCTHNRRDEVPSVNR
jgi:hypothetical protein